MKTTANSNATLWNAFQDSRVDLWDQNFFDGEYIIAYDLNPGLHQNVQNMLPMVCPENLSIMDSRITRNSQCSKTLSLRLFWENLVIWDSIRVFGCWEFSVNLHFRLWKKLRKWHASSLKSGAWMIIRDWLYWSEWIINQEGNLNVIWTVKTVFSKMKYFLMFRGFNFVRVVDFDCNFIELGVMWSGIG